VSDCLGSAPRFLVVRRTLTRVLFRLWPSPAKRGSRSGSNTLLAGEASDHNHKRPDVLLKRFKSFMWLESLNLALQCPGAAEESINRTAFVLGIIDEKVCVLWPGKP
jgi:hypothetical protein